MPPALARLLLHCLTVAALAGAVWVLAWGAGAVSHRAEAVAAGGNARGFSGTGPATEAAEAGAGGEVEAQSPVIQPDAWSWTRRRFQGPLFDPPPAYVPPPPPPVPPPLTLQGTVAEGEQSRAFVAGRDGVPRVMKVGDEVDGATLLSVASDHAVFRFAEREHRVELTK